MDSKQKTNNKGCLRSFFEDFILGEIIGNIIVNFLFKGIFRLIRGIINFFTP